MGYFIVKSLMLLVVIGVLIFGSLYLIDNKKSESSDKQPK